MSNIKKKRTFEVYNYTCPECHKELRASSKKQVRGSLYAHRKSKQHKAVMKYLELDAIKRGAINSELQN